MTLSVLFRAHPLSGSMVLCTGHQEVALRWSRRPEHGTDEHRQDLCRAACRRVRTEGCLEGGGPAQARPACQAAGNDLGLLSWHRGSARSGRRHVPHDGRDRRWYGNLVRSRHCGGTCRHHRRLRELPSLSASACPRQGALRCRYRASCPGDRRRAEAAIWQKRERTPLWMHRRADALPRQRAWTRPSCPFWGRRSIPTSP